MRFFILTAIFVTTLLSSELNWIHNYDTALAKAKKEKKDVYLFIGADKCRWCDRFKKMTLSNSDVIEKLQETYILIYMSRDRHQIPKKFKIRGVPRQYFLTSDVEIIYAAQGSREIDGFYDLLEEADLAK